MYVPAVAETHFAETSLTQQPARMLTASATITVIAVDMFPLLPLVPTAFAHHPPPLYTEHALIK
jgi:hypothetical protein